MDRRPPRTLASVGALLTQDPRPGLNLCGLLPCALSLGFLAVLHARTDWTAFVDSLGEMDLPWMGIMICTSMALSVLRGIRWGVPCGWRRAGSAPVKALFISRAGDNFLPLRIGDLVRIQYARDRGESPMPPRPPGSSWSW